MPFLPDWRGREVEVAVSAGGVLALAIPWDNMVRTGVSPWPPPELLQKVYQSRQVRAFVGADNAAATRVLGFYSDLQSIHSEDAITWSVFGPVSYAAREVRAGFVCDLLGLIDVPCDPFETATVWLWRRLPHPDTLVPGGPDASLLLSASAPITYVSAQPGRVNPSTTLRYYARWIPSKGRRWVDLLDRVTGAVAAAAEAVSGPIWNQIWNQNAPKSQIGHPGAPEVPDSIGGPSRIRTLDPPIKSRDEEPRTDTHNAVSREDSDPLS